jgi:transcriptional regulator with XRE-family HTH domain
VRRSSFPRKVGVQIRQAREQAGLSQQDVAVRAKIQQRTVSLVESGKRSITLTTLERLAFAIGVEPRDLIPLARK